ncbi:hypothetical protein [Tuwongella immobilis]
MTIDGALGVALVDYKNGMCLASLGNGINLDVAAAGNTEVMRAKMRTMASLKLKDTIEDILITLTSQYHIIMPLASTQELFLYLAVDRRRANLALARYSLRQIEKQLVM